MKINTEVPISKIEILENSRVNMKKSDLSKLMESINQHGLEQPIGVFPQNGEFVLVYGHRRLEACKKLGWKTIPAVLQEELELKDLLILNSIENLQRENISPAELGRICERLIELDMTPNEIAAKLSLQVSTVNVALDCYKGIPDKIRKKIHFFKSRTSKNGMIPASVMSKLIRLKKRTRMNEDYFVELVDLVKDKELTNMDIMTISLFIRSGLSVKRSVTESLKYRTYQIDFLAEIKLIDNLCKEHNTVPNNLLRSILYGEIKPLKKPEFIE